jgi:hypothetical protein
MPAWAQRPSGVWTGTLGRASIAACFDKDAASYYYVRIGVDIPLVEQKAPGTWKETKEAKGDEFTGLWQLSPPQGEAMSGVWTSPDGKRTLPIALTVSTGKSESYCLSPEYNAPRAATFVRIPDKETSVGGLRIRTFQARDIDITGLEIADKSAQLARLKRFVEKLNRDLVDQYLNCARFVEDREDWRGSIEFTGIVKLESVTRHFVLLRQSSAYFCGGAHPDSSSALLVVDRNSGDTIDIADWLKDPLDAIGRKYWKTSREDCKDALEEDTTFVVWPSPDGVVFAPTLPHAIEACSEEMTIPYARLASRLTPAGKRAAAEFAHAATSSAAQGTSGDK